MVTSRDVARLAGVSQATVSRALSAGSPIAPSTRAKVRAAMEQLGYVPHAGAQAMRTRRTNTIGVVLADIANPFYVQLLDEVTKVFDQAGQRVVIWNTANSDHGDALKAIGEYAVDGLVFTTATAGSVELAHAVERGRPIVLINREVDGVDCDKVVSDNVAGARSVADLFVEHGRTGVAFIGGAAGAMTARDRRLGFLGRMAELGHPVPEHLTFNGGFSHDAASDITRKLLARAERPTAVFCANDYMAFGAQDALCELGVSPRACWVVGYDDVDMASWASFGLTTVRQPTREMVADSVALLLERILNPELPPRRICHPGTLLVRRSTPLTP